MDEWRLLPMDGCLRSAMPRSHHRYQGNTGSMLCIKSGKGRTRKSRRMEVLCHKKGEPVKCSGGRNGEEEDEDEDAAEDKRFDGASILVRKEFFACSQQDPQMSRDLVP
ncbi:hypothetical protein MUCCIDRAFT_107356 [Mucor lusitanicus CBS 277.49]|uniref:Uncharacterized protein n=1 Tax=Mucor lusitanicus CBS 277.49 TaxID=747725 RepID=A0A162RKD4_MUCCL|nr:hypothetical protein MUCCIDRAFT_107356 [Mucor lusitanicus CBS 277.49]